MMFSVYNRPLFGADLGIGAPPPFAYIDLAEPGIVKGCVPVGPDMFAYNGQRLQRATRRGGPQRKRWDIGA